MTPAYLALGSNLGDRKTILDAAVAALAETPGVVVQAVSLYHDTAPVGGPTGQGAFLNAAAAIATSLDPFSLLDALHAIEAEAGRVRTVHWGERSLDLDLLLYGDRILDEPTLTIPHPRMSVRRFVLNPLAEIAPNVIHPLTRRTIVELIQHLDGKPHFVCLIGMPLVVFRRVAEALNAIGIYEATGSDRSYEAETDLSVVTPDFLTILDRKMREFDTSRWSEEIWGDRWMISDFCPDLMARDASYRLEDKGREHWRELYRECRPRIVRPSFIAAHPYSYWQLRRWADQNRDDPLGGSDIPLICPGYADAYGFMQRNFLVSRSLGPPAPVSTDTITAEILAACSASLYFTRPGSEDYRRSGT
jgi:2-amino-4-hydroxy-6-hydroxymethyldihydropteridine diphosphokinase